MMVLSDLRTFGLRPVDAVWVFGSVLLLYSVAAFVIGWPVIAAWRAVRDARTSRSRKAQHVIGEVLVVLAYKRLET